MTTAAPPGLPRWSWRVVSVLVVLAAAVSAVLLLAVSTTRAAPAPWLLPAIVLGIVFAISLPTLMSVAVQASPSGNAGGDSPLQVRVIGHQWWWEVRYPGLPL